MRCAMHWKLGLLLAFLLHGSKEGRNEFIDEQSTRPGNWSRCQWSDNGPVFASERVPGGCGCGAICAPHRFCCCRSFMGVASCGLWIPSRSAFSAAFQAVVHEFV